MPVVYHPSPKRVRDWIPCDQIVPPLGVDEIGLGRIELLVDFGRVDLGEQVAFLTCAPITKCQALR